MQRRLPNPGANRRWSSRRGAAYVLVVSVTAMIGVISYAALMNVRVLRRDMSQSNDWQEATWTAFSGMENAIARINNDANWRTTFTHNVETASLPFGQGSFSWRLVDPDGNLANNTSDSVRVIATGKVRKSTRVFSQELRPGGQGVDVLQTAVHCSGGLSTQSTTVWSGALSSDTTLTVVAGHTVTGNVQGVVIANLGTVTGTQTLFAPPKPMPATSVFDLYKARATTINYFSIPGGTIENQILSATNNPYGATNAEGIYYILIPYRNYKLSFNRCRIKATLLIEIEEKDTLEINSAVIWEPPAPNFPSLIAKALSTTGITIDIDGSGALYEATAGRNFNPPGLPYRGSENSNMTDTHMPLLRGLFHFIRLTGDTATTNFKGSMQRKGCFLFQGGGLSIKGSSFMNDPQLFADAPQGYIVGSPMRPVAGTYQWEAAP